MTDFKELLDVAIERKADNYSESMSKWEHQPSAFRGFLKGAALPSELLLLAIEALEKYSDLHHAPALDEALEQIKTKLEGAK